MKRTSTKQKSRKSLIAQLRAMAWFNAVSQASGLSAFQLEKKFSKPSQFKTTHQGTVRPCLWDKYRRGAVIPRVKAGQSGSPSLVERVELVYPGTAKWLTLPLWSMMEDKPIAMDEIKKTYEGLPETIRELFIENQPNLKLFWRRETESEDLYAKLELAGGLDALIGIITMMKEAEITQNRKQHHMGFMAWAKWMQCPRGIKSEPVMSAISDKLLEAIQQRYLSDYKGINSRD